MTTHPGAYQLQFPHRLADAHGWRRLSGPGLTLQDPGVSLLVPGRRGMNASTPSRPRVDAPRAANMRPLWTCRTLTRIRPALVTPCRQQLDASSPASERYGQPAGGRAAQHRDQPEVGRRLDVLNASALFWAPPPTFKLIRAANCSKRPTTSFVGRSTVSDRRRHRAPRRRAGAFLPRCAVNRCRAPGRDHHLPWRVEADRRPPPRPPQAAGTDNPRRLHQAKDQRPCRLPRRNRLPVRTPKVLMPTGSGDRTANARLAWESA